MAMVHPRQHPVNVNQRPQILAWGRISVLNHLGEEVQTDFTVIPIPGFSLPYTLNPHKFIRFRLEDVIYDAVGWPSPPTIYTVEVSWETDKGNSYLIGDVEGWQNSFVDGGQPLLGRTRIPMWGVD